MNTVNISGWIYDIAGRELKHGGYIASFKLKTKKVVGLKNKEKHLKEYDYIHCDMKGKKAKNFIESYKEGKKVFIQARLNLQDNNILYLAVDEIDM